MYPCTCLCTHVCVYVEFRSFMILCRPLLLKETTSSTIYNCPNLSGCPLNMIPMWEVFAHRRYFQKDHWTRLTYRGKCDGVYFPGLTGYVRWVE